MTKISDEDVREQIKQRVTEETERFIAEIIANPPPLAQRYDESDEEFKARAEEWLKREKP